MKRQYRIRNRSEYNAGLKTMGSLTFWVEESVLETWITPDLSGKPGASVYYSDLAIMTMATVKASHMGFNCVWTDVKRYGNFKVASSFC